VFETVDDNSLFALLRHVTDHRQNNDQLQLEPNGKHNAVTEKLQQLNTKNASTCGLG